jgi:hypothetical protein
VAARRVHVDVHFKRDDKGSAIARVLRFDGDLDDNQRGQLRTLPSALR